MVFAFGLMGCSSEGPARSNAVKDPVLAVVEVPPGPDPSYAPFVAGSALAGLSPLLKEAALSRSAAAQEARGAKSSVSAAKAGNKPRILPTGSATLTGDREVSLGLSVSQVLWDGGRTRSKITEAELRITDAVLRSWSERSEFVRAGLEAFVEYSMQSERIELQAKLADDLENLSKLLDSRVQGGVADRSETLKLEVALQEVRRELLSAASGQKMAAAELQSLLPEGKSIPEVPSPSSLMAACERAWPSTEAPQEALARLRAEQQKAAEEVLRTRRFPKLVIAAGAAIGSAATPGVGVQIDATDVIGPGAKDTITAAEAETAAALVSYHSQKVETRSKLDRLESEYETLKAEEVAMKSLIRVNEDNFSLYLEQVQAGTIQIADGISLLQEDARARYQLNETRSALARNCVNSNAIRGYLAEVGIEVNE